MLWALTAAALLVLAATAAANDGAYDPAFGQGGRTNFDLGSFEYATSVMVLPDRGVQLTGSCQSRLAGPNVATGCAIRLGADGALRPWGNLGDGRSLLGDVVGQGDAQGMSIGQSLVDANGRLILTLGLVDAPFFELRVVRLDPQGVAVESSVSLPPHPDARADQGPLLIAPDAVGGWVVVSYFAIPSSVHGFRVHRIGPDFQLDTDFGVLGEWRFQQAGFSLTASALRVDGQGRILVASERVEVASLIRQIGVFRLLANGQPDVSFGVDGLALVPLSGTAPFRAGLAVDALDRVSVAASVRDPVEADFDLFVARFNADGLLDGEFAEGSGLRIIEMEDFTGLGQDEDLVALETLPDGSLLAVGSTPRAANRLYFLAVHLDGAGRLIPGFGLGGYNYGTFESAPGLGLSDAGLALAPDPAGFVLIAGQAISSLSGSSDLGVARLGLSAARVDPLLADGFESP